MRTRSKLAVAAIVATMLLGICVTQSIASRFELERTPRGLSIFWSSLNMESAAGTVACRVLLAATIEEGTFGTGRRTFTKTAGTTLGAVTNFVLESCTGGSAEFLTITLNWPLTYQSFGGTLPNITSFTFDLLRVGLRVQIGGLGCLISTERSEPIRAIGRVIRDALGHLRITDVRLDERATISLIGGFLCGLGGRAHLSGTGAATGISGGETPLLALIA